MQAVGVGQALAHRYATIADERLALLKDDVALLEDIERQLAVHRGDLARGFELRAVGLQPDAAEYGGVRVGGVWIRAMTLSGALAGLGGINHVLGYKHYYEDAFAGGAGFLGIAVALVGRNHPLGVVLAALFFATLSQGGLAIHALVPKQMVEVLQGIVILSVAMAVPEVRRLLRQGAAGQFDHHFRALAERLVKAGVKELLVISQDTSAYGVDLKHEIMGEIDWE